MSDPSETGLGTATGSLEGEGPHPGDQFAVLGKRFDDNRNLGEWQTRYPKEARRCINNEAWALFAALILLLAISGVLLSIADESLKVHNSIYGR